MSKKIFVIIAIIAIVLIVFIIAHFKGSSVTIKKDTTLDFTLDESLKEALYIASFAPSSHNAQNWIVKLSPEKQKIYIYLDETRVLKEVDPNKREAYLSIGAFVETLAKSLEAYGYENQLIINNDENDDLVVALDYNKVDITNNMDIVNTIMKRHTDKRKYNDADIPENTINSLLKGDNVYYYPKSTDIFQYLSEGTISAFKKQSYDDNKRKELAEWLRFSDDETKQKKDGLPAEQLGLSGIIKTIYYLSVNKEGASSDSFAKSGIKKTIDQINNCSGFFIITGDNHKSGLVETGIYLQKFWLNATVNNIAIHPVSQMLEEVPYADEIHNRLKLDKPVQMILRAGIVDDYGTNKKIRRDLKEFVFLEN